MSKQNPSTNFKLFWSKSNSPSTSESNNSPSERSRKSILQGSKAFIWNNELSRTDRPYTSRKYDIPFNPPPNEVNYIGGIGKGRGRARSKLHPNRPTLVQKIYGMRNINRIDVNFTQPLAETNACVTKDKVKIPYDQPRPCPANTINEIVQKVSFSEFKDDVARTSGSGSSNVALEASQSLKRPVEHESLDSITIDGRPFFLDRKEIRLKAKSIVDKAIDKHLDITPVIETDRIFKQRARDEREKFKNRDRIPHHTSPEPSDVSSIDSSVAGPQPRRMRKMRKTRRKFIRNMRGHMFGPFTKPVTPDKLTVQSDKFGVPSTMINRVRKAYNKRRIKESVLRRVRFAHMGYIQPPNRDESSDNESLQKVKRLALVRTPYFVIPTIKISQVKKKDRFRNKFLKKDRLKRINLLLNYQGSSGKRDSDKEEGSDESDEEDIGDQKRGMGNSKKQQFFAKFFQLSTKKKSELKRVPVKAKYYKVIMDKYEELKRQCEPQKKPSTQLTFDEFKIQEDKLHSNQFLETDRNSLAKTTLNSQGEDLDDKNYVLGKLFRRKKNYRLRKLDDVEGPLYTDPYITEKLRNPKKFTARTKYYANLFKSRCGVRNRLQVNAPNYEEEKIGAKDTYFTRLATEWDEYYIHELRHRRLTKKFCVKTDILLIRDIVRKNYLMYYAQENLLDLKAEQTAEMRRLELAEAAGEARLKKFGEMTNEVYGHVVQKNTELAAVQLENKKLRSTRDELTELCDKLSKDILISEREWEFLLLIQNYYYLLLNTEWRILNDWIHRSESGDLLPPLIAIRDCASRNMRDKSVCSAYAVKEHFEENIVPNLDKMKAPNAPLLKTSLESLVKKSFTTLTQHNKTLWTYKTIFQIHQKLKNDMKTFKEIQQRKMDVMTKKQKFMAERQAYLEQFGHKLLQRGISEALNQKTERKIMAISEVLYRRFAPPEQISEQLIDDVTPMDKFTYIHRFCMELLRILDEIPADILVICEKSTRDRRREDKNRSKWAVVQQQRFEMWTKQIKHQFAPVAEFRRINVGAPVMGRKSK